MLQCTMDRWTFCDAFNYLFDMMQKYAREGDKCIIKVVKKCYTIRLHKRHLPWRLLQIKLHGHITIPPQFPSCISSASTTLCLEMLCLDVQGENNVTEITIFHLTLFELRYYKKNNCLHDSVLLRVLSYMGFIFEIYSLSEGQRHWYLHHRLYIKMDHMTAELRSHHTSIAPLRPGAVQVINQPPPSGWGYCFSKICHFRYHDVC